MCVKRCTSKSALMLATCTLLVTWGYILKWTVEYKQGGGNNLFDDAYVDVLEPPHFGTSAQLLTWVVVAVVWTHNAPVEYMIFGMLGAMSATFLMWVPQLTIAEQRRTRKVPACFVVTSVLALDAIVQLRPTVDKPDDFRFWLWALHVLLVLPVFVAWLYPTQPKVDSTWLYFALAAGTAYWHHFGTWRNTIFCA